MTEPCRYDLNLLRKLWVEGVRNRDIAVQLGCSWQHVSALARRAGLPKRLRSSGDLPQRAMVLAYESGESANSIARRAGCSLDTCLRILRMHGVPIRGRNGRNGHWLKDAEACVRLHRQGFTYRQIGQRLGLTYAQVGHRIARLVGRNGHGSNAWKRQPRLEEKRRVAPE